MRPTTNGHRPAGRVRQLTALTFAQTQKKTIKFTGIRSDPESATGQQHTTGQFEAPRIIFCIYFLRFWFSIPDLGISWYLAAVVFFSLSLSLHWAHHTTHCPKRKIFRCDRFQGKKAIYVNRFWVNKQKQNNNKKRRSEIIAAKYKFQRNR